MFLTAFSDIVIKADNQRGQLGYLVYVYYLVFSITFSDICIYRYSQKGQSGSRHFITVDNQKGQSGSRVFPIVFAEIILTVDNEKGQSGCRVFLIAFADIADRVLQSGRGPIQSCTD